MQPGPHFLTPPKKNLIQNYALLQRHKWVIFEPRSSEWFWTKILIKQQIVSLVNKDPEYQTVFSENGDKAKMKNIKLYDLAGKSPPRNPQKSWHLVKQKKIEIYKLNCKS